MPQTIEHLNQPQESETSRTKKAYHAPRLRDYGDLRERTQTTTSGTGTDGGGVAPNVYAS